MSESQSPLPLGEGEGEGAPTPRQTNLQSFYPSTPVQIGAALSTAARLLSANVEPEAAQIEAQLLLGYCLGIDRAKLYSRLHSDIPYDKLSEFSSLVERRLAGEPVAYIVGHREFYGLDFLVDPRVLIPRPETELIVEAVLRRFAGASGRQLVVADVGTGSGAIAISLAVNLPRVKVIAVDSSAGALEVAAANGVRHSVGDRVKLVQGDLLEPVTDRLDVVVANLPYIRRSRLQYLPRDVRDFEPIAALDGGEDGLDYYRRLLPRARLLLARPGCILMEIDPDQRGEMEKLVLQHFPAARLAVLQDYAGHDRVVCADIPSDQAPARSG